MHKFRLATDSRLVINESFELFDLPRKKQTADETGSHYLLANQIESGNHPSHWENFINYKDITQ
jgi:hypothetical protein